MSCKHWTKCKTVPSHMNWIWSAYYLRVSNITTTAREIMRLESSKVSVLKRCHRTMQQIRLTKKTWRLTKTYKSTHLLPSTQNLVQDRSEDWLTWSSVETLTDKSQGNQTCLNNVSVFATESLLILLHRLTLWSFLKSCCDSAQSIAMCLLLRNSHIWLHKHSTFKLPDTQAGM